ncbi:hypothetical protein MWU75_13775 [Ornithinimicrobium sp. F0845]|uniref:hypothetical protein n=1 Tax=Ornithinimicrobium sp. F0845 TaxID=2926412 RepID=UPI001FF597ED|nr:hypothetical protein [Ornithinimicrobium sp. F0845]MCK0113212.1 hypothetical protein [Ornithinimicrobium sp. F0845]
MPATARQRAAVVVAGLLVVLSLGLPWTTSSQTYVPGWMAPSMCIPTADGTIWCSGSFLSPGFMTGSAALSGAGSVARVFLVGALVLIVVAWVRREHRWLGLAGAGLAVAVLLAGLTALGGQIAACAAALLLIYAALSPRPPAAA